MDETTSVTDTATTAAMSAASTSDTQSHLAVILLTLAVFKFKQLLGQCCNHL